MLLLQSLATLRQGTENLVFEPFSFLWTDNISFIPSRADDKSSTDRLSIHLQAIVLPEKRNENLLFWSAYCWSFLTFAFCFLELFQYNKCLFGIVFQLTLDYYKSCQNRQCKMIAPILLSAGELLLPHDLNWTLVFVSFLSRYPSNTDNQIYSNSETRIRNLILLVFILYTASFQICLWISPCVYQCFAHYNSIAPRKISDLGGLSLVSSWKPCLFYRCFCFLLSAKCRFWRIPLKRFRIIVIWIPLLPIRLSILQQSWVTYWLP